jgi:tetratricopeptide (TPR) repeat protein
VAFADRALALLPDDDWVSRYDMLRLQADALAVLGRSEQRKQTLTTLLWVAAKLVRTQAVEPLGRKFGQSLLSRAQGLLARYYFDVGDFRLAQASAEECLASSVDCPPPVVANALALLAQVHARCTRFDQASILLEQALHVIKSDNDTRCLAMIHNDLGNLKSDQGDIAAAMGHYRVSLQLYKQDIYRSNQLSVRVNLGYAYLQTGDYELARSEFRQCIDYLDAVGDLIAAATARINLAMVLERLNEMTLAKREVSEAVKHLEELKDPWTLAAGLRVLGQIESCLGDYVAAQAILTRAADLCRSLELVVPLCEVMAAQVENCLRHGRLDLADQLAACVQEMLQPDWCLDGAEQPARMALVIFRARLSSDLPAARRLLGIARSNIIKQAIRFSEHVLRRKYIYGIAEHSAISTAWKAMRLRSERLD